MLPSFANSVTTKALETLKLFAFACFILGYGSNLSKAQTPAGSVNQYLNQADYLVSIGVLDSALQVLSQAEEEPRQTFTLQDKAKLMVKRGIIHQIKGDYNNALNLQLKALELSERATDSTLTAEVLNNIGSIHHTQENYADALRYYRSCLAIREKLGVKKDLALSYNNFGSLYEDMGQLNEAHHNLSKSLALWQELNDSSWVAVTYANLGSTNETEGKLDDALVLYHKSLSILESIGRGSQSGKVMSYIGRVMLKKNDPEKALKWCNKSLAIANQWETVSLSMQSCKCLQEAYDQLKNPIRAYNYFQRYIGYRDSLSSQEITRELTKLEMDYAFKKQLLADSLELAKERIKTEFEFNERIEKQRNQRNIFLLIGIGILMLAAGLYSRLRFMRRSRKAIQLERDRSDQLLLNILPASIAEELKTTGKTIARDYHDVSILFTDIVGFTKHAERMSAHELIDELNMYFAQFDKIALQHGLEKIKTIGDSYMVAGGLPYPNKEAAKNTILAALDMISFIDDVAKKRALEGKQPFQMRFGIHTGAVVAGIVGNLKFQYDIWGDAVNTASRMESCSEIGRINISEATYQLVRNEPNFQFEPRGHIEAKGKGEMSMYFVYEADKLINP